MTTRVLFLSAILGLAGCQCGTRVVGADSELTIDPASVDFGTLRANQRASRELVARVTGRLAIDVTEVRVEQGADRFTTTATTGSIAPGGELRFTVDYRAPSTAGLDEATLVLIAATEVRVPLRGRVELSQCLPGTCGARCGSIYDGCGGTLNCGACCVPTTCASTTCGTISDGCGGTLTCGPACECTPVTCGARGATCGSIPDGCGGTLTCGACTGNSTCTDNQCACVPQTCATRGASCGSLPDGCGGTLSCGTCTGSTTCTDNQCACVPETCASRGATCGTVSDGCGGTLTCGTCGPGASCAQSQCTCAASGAEDCSDGVDNDCDGAVDCADTQCATTSACMQPACAITDVETQATQSVGGAFSGFLSWTGAEWGLFTHEAWGAGNGRYAFQRLDVSGQPAGPSVPMSGAVAHRPFAAWTGTEFGLAWSDVRNPTQSNDVYFNRVTPAGLTMSASDVGISTAPGLAFPSSIAWNPTAQEFGVLWGDDRSAGSGTDRALYFRRVDAAGNLAGAEVRLTPSPTGVTTDYSDLTWGGANWGIVVTQLRNNSPFMLFNRLSSTGAPELTDLQLNASGQGAYMPRIAANATHYAAVFQEYRTAGTDIVLTLIAKSGPPNPLRVALTTSGSASNPTVVWAGTSWAVVFQDNRTGVRRLSLARLAADGTRLGPDALLSCMTTTALLPHLAFNGTRLAVTWTSPVAGTQQSFIKTFAP